MEKSLGYIYSAQLFSNNNEFEKIGKTTDYKARLSDYNSEISITPIIYNWVLEVYSDNHSLKKIETMAHTCQSDYHKNKEIFYRDINSLTNIKKYLQNNNVYIQILRSPEKIKPLRRKRKPKEVKSKKTILRSYQNDAIAFMNFRDRCTIIAPPGTGKTQIYISYLKTQPGVWIVLVPTKELVNQISEKLRENEIKCSTYQENLSDTISLENTYVILSTYQSSDIIIEKYTNNITGVIYDECHRVVISRENKKSLFQYAVKTLKNVEKHYFFTATSKFIDEIFDNVISMDIVNIFGEKYEYTYNQALLDGYICDYKAIIKKCDYNSIHEIISYNAPYKTIIFVNTTNEADELRENLTRDFPNYMTISYHSKNRNNKKREDIKTVEKTIICTCDLLATGFDQPDITAIIHFPLTKSYIQNTQRNGRAQRLFPGKTHCNYYYCVREIKEVRTVISLLGYSDMRIKSQLIPIVCNIGAEKENGKLYYEVDVDNSDIPRTTITKELVDVCLANKSDTQKLQIILRNKNKRDIVLIDRAKTIEEYKNIFSDISELCRRQNNFVKFALPLKMYNQYISKIIMDKEIIKNTFKKICIRSPRDYKLHGKIINKYNLPSYEFVLNGGIDSIKTISSIFEEENIDDEN